jgi:hypothetical protein
MVPDCGVSEGGDHGREGEPHSSGIPALRNPANNVASSKARIFGGPRHPGEEAFAFAMLE